MYRTKHHEKPLHQIARDIKSYSEEIIKIISDGKLAKIGIEDRENLPLAIIAQVIINMNTMFSIYKSKNFLAEGIGYRGFT
jgi:hypothetical protein